MSASETLAPGDRVLQHKDGSEGPRYLVLDAYEAASGERVCICQVVGRAEVFVDNTGDEIVREIQAVRPIANGEIFEIRASSLAKSED